MANRRGTSVLEVAERVWGLGAQPVRLGLLRRDLF